ncbi:MAG: hypothetical protein JNM14_04155 [Ferruginibacter sp.]|nr:hypothetical protein [Ferruginibacter sp.]
MIRFILIPLSIMLGCGSTKTSQSTAKRDTVTVEQPADLNQKDSVVVSNTKNTNGQDANNKDLQGESPGDVVIPSCIKTKIDSFKLKEAHEKPQRVVEYMYKGKKVYYVVMPCCDFFNEVYDDKCNFLGAPDGGFTGKGDGKLPDFFEEAKNKKLVWGKPE